MTTRPSSSPRKPSSNSASSSASRAPSNRQGASRGRAKTTSSIPQVDTLAEIDIPFDEPSAITRFSELDLAKPIRDALAADGYEQPTPIQARAIPPALLGRDMLGIAQTGTGKTAAFALPILQHLLTHCGDGSRLVRGRKPMALILAPTRELAAQIGESFASYGRHTPLRMSVIFGGVGQAPQVRALQQGLDILIATPGRLTDLCDQGLLDLRSIAFFVLDEADRMLDMGFIHPIRKIAALLPTKRQTMLFSATMPKEIRHLAAALLRDPVTVSVTPVSSAVDRIEQALYFVPKSQKTALLIHLFDDMEMDKVVVFTKTKHGADRLVRKLSANGIEAQAIHGNKNQNQRVRALDAFKSGKSPVLVATDVAARGLDIDDVTHVVNFDLPMEPEAYVHRIGRTARAGKSGHAVSFCDGEEHVQLKQVERLVKFEIPRVKIPDSIPVAEEPAPLPPQPPRHGPPRTGRGAPPNRSAQPGPSVQVKRSSGGARPAAATSAPAGHGRPRPAASAGHPSAPAGAVSRRRTER